MGSRVETASTMLASPIPIVTASNPDAASSGEAPTAARPCSTTTNADVKPTSPETMPAATGVVHGPRGGRSAACRGGVAAV